MCENVCWPMLLVVETFFHKLCVKLKYHFFKASLRLWLENRISQKHEKNTRNNLNLTFEHGFLRQKLLFPIRNISIISRDVNYKAQYTKLLF